jgi:hypothetical protein
MQKNMKGMSIGVILGTFIMEIIGLALFPTIVSSSTVATLAPTSLGGVIVALIPGFYALLLLFGLFAGLGIGIYA